MSEASNKINEGLEDLSDKKLPCYQERCDIYIEIRYYGYKLGVGSQCP